MLTENAKRRSCIVVSVEAPWPTLNGGRARTSEIIRQLAVDYEVSVVYPGAASESQCPISGVQMIPVDGLDSPRVSDRLGLQPRLGKVTLRPLAPALGALVQRLEPEFIYWSHSYLAAAGMHKFQQLPHLVEFANIEGHRSLSLSRSSKNIWNRVSALTEYLKSLWWEPRCARHAAIAISLNHHEANVLRNYGANVAHVPNGFSQREYSKSPRESRTVLTLGSWVYGPNKVALESFLTSEWPEILRREPSMKLTVVGPGSEDLLGGDVSLIEGVSSLGYVEDLAKVFQDCFCFLAPASSGGGSQLKIAEAFSRHRVVVGPSYLRREISPDMPNAAVVASNNLVESVINLAKSVDSRHSTESALVEFVGGRTWQSSFSPIRAWVTEAHDREWTTTGELNFD